jgi:hypothetical protein
MGEDLQQAVLNSLSSRKRLGFGMAVFAGGLWGCTAAPPPKPAPPPIAVAAVIVPSPLPPALPYAPGSAATTLVLPARDMVSGSWFTPNSNLGAEQSLWHLRIGLNVAALGCRGFLFEQQLIDNYNAFQKLQQPSFVKAERAVIKNLASKTGTNGIAERDKLSTRLYNYFAQPPVKYDFCPVAFDVSTRALAAPTADIFTFAQTNLPQLEAPFQNFYSSFAKYQADTANYPTAYRQYQADLAQWNAKYGKRNPVAEQAPQMVLPPLLVAPPVIVPATAPTTATAPPAKKPGG